MDLSKGFNWGPGIFLILYHAILLAVLPFYFYYYTPSLGIVITTIVLYFVSGMSITGGYHRLYSHRAYKANPVVELFLIFFGTLAGQGSVIRWSYDHRRHHAYVDTDNDPYSIKKGFWYAHMLWLFEKPLPIEGRVVSDLLRKPILRFQHRHYGWCFVATNVIVFLVTAWVSQEWVSAFVLAWWVRLFALHHSTWFINSLAHTWGDKPYCQEQSAVNNYIISLLTFGEGYHNFHHTYANDYRNGIRWYHFDPTKWMIWTLEKLGFAKGLKTIDSETLHKRMLLERKSLLLDRLKKVWLEKREEAETIVQELSDRIILEISKLNELKSKYRKFKKECEAIELQKIKEELNQIKKSLGEDWKRWKTLSKQILKARPGSKVEFKAPA